MTGDLLDITEEDIRRSRRAYFANISYLDDKVGEFWRLLESTRQEATILFVSDHGDMLGERGLWFKMSFLEGSARVPMMIAAPQMEAGLVETPVSNIDVCPTLCDLAGVSMVEVMPWTTGESLVTLGQGGGAHKPGGHGICCRGELFAAGLPSAWALEVHQLRARSRAAF